MEAQECSCNTKLNLKQIPKLHRRTREWKHARRKRVCGPSSALSKITSRSSRPPRLSKLDPEPDPNLNRTRNRCRVRGCCRKRPRNCPSCSISSMILSPQNRQSSCVCVCVCVCVVGTGKVLYVYASECVYMYVCVYICKCVNVFSVYVSVLSVCVYVSACVYM